MLQLLTFSHKHYLAHSSSLAFVQFFAVQSCQAATVYRGLSLRAPTVRSARSARLSQNSARKPRGSLEMSRNHLVPLDSLCRQDSGCCCTPEVGLTHGAKFLHLTKDHPQSRFSRCIFEHNRRKEFHMAFPPPLLI